MDKSWIFIVIIAILLLWTFSRRRKPRSNKLDTAMALLADINNNLKVMEIRLNDHLSKKNFKTSNWQFYKERMEFLGPEVVTTLNEAFTISEEFKNKIDIAKKSSNLASLQDLPIEKLKEPLTKSRKGVVDWLRANVQTEMQSDRRRSWLGF